MGDKVRKKTLYYTFDEFLEKFGYTREKAIYEIKHHGIKASYTLPRLKTLLPFGGPYGHPSLIPRNEVERYAAIIAENESPPTQYMDKDRQPAFSSELEAAVSCWMALFSDATPAKVATHTREKAMSWLSKNRPELEESQHKRIATLLTPDARKSGGAPPATE
ncbi:MAG: hypothetical protein JJE30_18645 [Desulfuromonadales bacterium]|nr:hypothetical protein [Desulfuromonadales bacterium]